MINYDVRHSFDRCETTGQFAEQFYEIFLNSSPEVERLFANTDFNKQRKLLRASVYVLVTRDIDDPKAKELLNRVGHSHSRSQLDIKPELYELWLESLCQTVKRMDPKWTPELEQAWCDQMRKGIDLITSLY